MPPSVLFFGRRVYWGVIVVLVCALRQQRDDSASYRKLQELVGVHRSTVWRWMEYFRECFPQTPGWRGLKDRLHPDVDTGEAPDRITPEDARDSVRMIMAEIESVNSGEQVDVW